MTDLANLDAQRQAVRDNFFEADAATLDAVILRDRTAKGAYKQNCEMVIDGSTYKISLTNRGFSVSRTLGSTLKHLFFGNRSAAIQDRLNKVRALFDQRLGANETARGVMSELLGYK